MAPTETTSWLLCWDMHWESPSATSALFIEHWWDWWGKKKQKTGWSELHQFMTWLDSITGCPRMFYTQKCKILRSFITIKTIKFGILIYFSDRTVLLAFWIILNQGNRPNKTENTSHYVKRVIFCILIEVGKEDFYKLFSLTHGMLFLFICSCVLCLFWVKNQSKKLQMTKIACVG